MVIWMRPCCPGGASKIRRLMPGISRGGDLWRRPTPRSFQGKMHGVLHYGASWRRPAVWDVEKLLGGGRWPLSIGLIEALFRGEAGRSA